jgi:hypothetical protein
MNATKKTDPESSPSNPVIRTIPYYIRTCKQMLKIVETQENYTNTSKNVEKCENSGKHTNTSKNGEN